MEATQPWVILRRVLVRKDPEAKQAGHPPAISTALRSPPRVTNLAVAVGPNAHPGRPVRFYEVPYLVATGPSALLYCFYFDVIPLVTDELLLARRFVAPADAKRQPTTGSADRVPRRTGSSSMPVTYNIRNVGLIPGLSGGYVIAELQVTKRSNRAKLFRLMSGDDRRSEAGRLFEGDRQRWYETELHCPLPTMEREWAPQGVVSLANKLWWFDLSWGLLSCDPNDIVHPVLSYHKLPPGCVFLEPMAFIHYIRCICVSENMLRYVEMVRGSFRDGMFVGEQKVVMWTLVPVPSGDGDIEWKWHKSYEMDFKDIWDDAIYKAAGLPALVPQIVLVSPRNHNVVYFFRDNRLFGIDVPSHRLVHVLEDCYKLEAPVHSLSVFPWDLPSWIANGNCYRSIKFSYRSCQERILHLSSLFVIFSPADISTACLKVSWRI